MITGFFLSSIYAIFFTLISVFPAASSMPSAILDSASGLGRILYSWNLIFPVSDLLIVVELTITLIFAVFGVRAIFYVMALFRGNSMPGN